MFQTIFQLIARGSWVIWLVYDFSADYFTSADISDIQKVLHEKAWFEDLCS